MMKVNYILLIILGYSFVIVELKTSGELPALEASVVFADTARKPNVMLEHTQVSAMNIIFVRDTVRLSDLSRAFQSGYSQLFTFSSEQGLTVRKTLACYASFGDPLVLEIGIEVDHVPNISRTGIQSKLIDGGSAVIAHYTGPYSRMDIPYNAIAVWLKEHNRQAKGTPIEVYINDPASVSDSMQLRTDIYQMMY